MRLSRRQTSTLFVIFCVAIVTLLGLEVYASWQMIGGAVSGSKTAAVAALTIGLLAGCGAIFKKMLDAAFLAREVLPTARLQRLHSERCAIIVGRPSSDHGSFETRRGLVTNTLRFAEETLNGWIKGSHFELCVFVDPEQPLLFAYFDSNHDAVARSMAERDINPKFYIEKGYEVTKLLRTPTSHPRVIEDTHNAKAKYVFTSAAQQKQLRSTLLLCLDLGYPCALVVSSNEAGAIPETDPQFMSFVRYVGEMVRYDLVEDGFLPALAKDRPDLFPRETHLVIEHSPMLEGLPDAPLAKARRRAPKARPEL